MANQFVPNPNSPIEVRRAFQQLNAENASLRSEIVELKARVTETESDISALDVRVTALETP